MELDLALMIGVFVLLSAILYSSVGHGGGSGYLAVMALFAVSTDVMRPAALVLNIGVASIGAIAYIRRGAFSFRALWPFAATAIPAAYLGGRMDVPGLIYKPLLAAVLLYSAYYLFSPRSVPHDDPDLKPPIAPALASGGGLGLLAGLTGIGGGIFLSPLLLFNGWCSTRKASGVAAVFILVNSAAGLAGQLGTLASIPLASMAVWLPTALVGGYLGSLYGSRTTATKNIYRLLALVLVVAAVKLLLTLSD
ncbi:sulfite exporter TauE/SafE family protein [Nocardioides sp.]|uniref:sulfite exporter TauE/SafE family protein n=1 Tax=Nocardioides sp. TaxID=35761 RepID=UPI002ED7CD4B